MRRTTGVFRARDFCHPRHWPTWLMIALLWLCARLPWSLQLWLGRRFGDALRWLHAPRRRITAINLALCFPGCTENQREQLLRKSFQAFGMSLFEMASLWFRARKDIQQHCRVEGLEHFEAARKAGQGVILLQAHFTTLEIGGSILATQVPLAASFDSPKNPLFAAVLLNRRQCYIKEMIDSRSIRQMVRRLRDGGCVWYAPDQHARVGNSGVESEFFQQAVYATGGTARIAKISNARVLPFLSVRDADNDGYVLKVFPPLTNFPGASVTADTQRINDLFELQIRQYPEQYFWLHKRFKRLKKSQPDPYR